MSPSSLVAWLSEVRGDSDRLACNSEAVEVNGPGLAASVSGWFWATALSVLPEAVRTLTSGAHSLDSLRQSFKRDHRGRARCPPMLLFLLEEEVSCGES